MRMSVAKRLVGRAAGLAMPGLRAEVRAGDLLSGSGNRRRLKRWLSKDDILRLRASAKDTAVEEMLTSRWTDAHIWPDYYDLHAERFERLFQGPHGVALDWLEQFAQRCTVTDLIEVGCGDGRALAKIAERQMPIDRLLGIDINHTIIERNKSRYADLDIAFIEADATRWLEDNCRANTVLMTVGGVMEYIAPATLDRWFRTLVSAGGAGVLLIEPIDESHDLERGTESFVHGMEDSFSHNYPHLLTQAGLKIVEQKEARGAGARWIMVLAEVPEPAR